MQDVTSSSSLFNRARQVLVQQPALPLPGGGQTLQRWQALAAWGAEDLCLAKVLEAHYDALAILAELGEPAPPPGQLWAVWAAEPATMKVDLAPEGSMPILNGTKAWITNAGKSTWYTVMAVTDPEKKANGISAFMVHKDDEGFSVGEKERKLGIKGSPTRELYFENCRIPGDRIIGEPGTGFKTALKTLDHTRPTIGAQAVGIAQGALDAAIAYTKDRTQFGKAISTFQGVEFMLADMAMQIEAARLMVYTAAARAERGEENLGFITAASKCFASDVAMKVTTDAVQLFGGAGYTRDFPVERMMRDAKITQIYEGTNQIQRVVMSRALLR